MFILRMYTFQHLFLLHLVKKYCVAVWQWEVIICKLQKMAFFVLQKIYAVVSCPQGKPFPNRQIAQACIWKPIILNESRSVLCNCFTLGHFVNWHQGWRDACVCVTGIFVGGVGQAPFHNSLHQFVHVLWLTYKIHSLSQAQAIVL